MDENDINNSNNNDDEQCVYVTRSESGRLLIQHDDDDTSSSAKLFHIHVTFNYAKAPISLRLLGANLPSARG